MTSLYNEISIRAPIEKIWEALSNIDELEKYDPTVRKSTLVSSARSGTGAKRKVDMKDGKNWFEEKCTLWKPNEELAFELTACSFPVHRLKHTYSFEKAGTEIKVKQIMEYEVKYGWVGMVLDALVIRKQSDSGVKKFFSGLKRYVEN
jgi:ribosome-associated toxin RatA of RatAB toxin-antitoxin module